jgi:hypothetical protein
MELIKQESEDFTDFNETVSDVGNVGWRFEIFLMNWATGTIFERNHDSAANLPDTNSWRFSFSEFVCNSIVGTRTRPYRLGVLGHPVVVHGVEEKEIRDHQSPFACFDRAAPPRNRGGKNGENGVDIVDQLLIILVMRGSTLAINKRSCIWSGRPGM